MVGEPQSLRGPTRTLQDDWIESTGQSNISVTTMDIGFGECKLKNAVEPPEGSVGQ